VGRYSVTNAKAGVNTANTIMWQLKASATERYELLEVTISAKAAPTTAPSWRLNRGTALGTSTATIQPQPEDPDDDTASTLLDTTWSANPTAGGVDLREFAHPAAIGNGIVWTFYNKPIQVNRSTGLLFINGNASGATLGTLTITCTFDE
jgi:hypothetical protein